MNFAEFVELWESFGIRKLYEVEAKTERVAEQLGKTFEHIVPGRWAVERSKKILTTITTREIYKTNLIGKNVLEQGDKYRVFVTTYVYKYSPEKLQNLSPEIAYNPPDWITNPDQWEDYTGTYDTKEGHPLVYFYVSIRGRKSNASKSDPIGMFDFGGGLYPIADSHEMKLPFKNPFEVAKWSKEQIENWHGFDGWNDDDYGDDFGPDSHPSPTDKNLVGA